jgi:1,2-phenylacetyl-CoA epoxidase PaaB subunit
LNRDIGVLHAVENRERKVLHTAEHAFEQRRRVIVYIWIKEAALANLDSSSLCRKAIFRLQTPRERKL